MPTKRDIGGVIAGLVVGVGSMVGVNTTTPVQAIAEVSALEETYFKANNKYLQIVKGNKLPEYEKGSVRQKLGKNLGRDIEVTVYDSPKGKGYQILYKDTVASYSVGFGPEADDRTWIRPIPAVVASSTPV